MNARDARAAVPMAGQPLTVQYGEMEPLGWDGIAAVIILVIAAAPVRDWVPEHSLVPDLVRALWWLIYVATAARLFQQFGIEWLRWTIRRQPALCVLLGLTLASCLWSLAPAVTLQKAVSLCGTTMVALWIGYVGSPARLMRVLYWTFSLLILASVAVAVALPQPIPQDPFAWRGIMTNRNSLGAVAAMATAFFLIVTLRRQVHPAWGTVLCALSMLALAQARSRTPFVALSVCLVAWLAVAAAALAQRSVAALVRGLAIGLVLAVSVVPFIIAPEASSKPDPLNGRTAIWTRVQAIVRERPLSGYGYAVAWDRRDDTLLSQIDVTGLVGAVTAHNSIAQVATELGIPAAIVACVYVFAALCRAGQLYERAPSAFSFCALLLLIGITVMGFSEAHLLQIHWPFWMLVVALTVAVTRSLNAVTTRARLEVEP